MKLLKLLTLWPPFGGDEDESPDPPHYHELNGPNATYHLLNGPKTDPVILDGSI